VVCTGLCGGLYYTIFHSSYPLSQIEKALESDGNIEIEGLTGSISSGFHIDQLRFVNAQDQWSTLKEIDFEFNGVWDLVNEHRLIIDRFTVGSGEIYYGDWDNDLAMGGSAGTGAANPAGTQPPGGPVGGTGTAGPMEVRIDLVEFANLKFLNSDGDVKSELGRVAFSDFHYRNGKIQNMGPLEVEGFVARGDRFEVEQLTGSTDSGFHMERLRFRDDDGEWSELNGMDFQFNGVNDLMENKRLVIDRWSIESGRLYCDWNGDKDDPPGDEDEPHDAAGNQADDGQTMLKQMRIGLIHFPNLTLVNSVTGVEFQIDEISVEDIEFQGDTLTQLGDVTVTADHVELKTNPSSRFPDQPESVVTRNFSGVVRSGIHERVRADIPFDVDVCFAEKGEILVGYTLFDGKIVSSEKGGGAEVTLTDFTFTDYVDWPHGPLPSRINAQIRVTRDAENRDLETYAIAPGATFHVGRLTFDVETAEIAVDKKSQAAPPIVAVHDAESGQIRCRLYALQDEPYWAIELESESDPPAEDLYADVLFGHEFESLDDDRKKQIKSLLESVPE
jgi:hypothetical protein